MLLLRWYWWRVNAWSEITATIVPVITYTLISLNNLLWLDQAVLFPDSMFLIVGTTTVSWVLVTLLTRPADRDVLSSFYRRVRPSGFWRPLRESHPEITSDGGTVYRILGWILGVILIYSVLFLLSEVFFGDTAGILLWAGITGLTAPSLWLLLWRMESAPRHDSTV